MMSVASGEGEARQVGFGDPLWLLGVLVVQKAVCFVFTPKLSPNSRHMSSIALDDMLIPTGALPVYLPAALPRLCLHADRHHCALSSAARGDLPPAACLAHPPRKGLRRRLPHATSTGCQCRGVNLLHLFQRHCLRRPIW